MVCLEIKVIHYFEKKEMLALNSGVPYLTYYLTYHHKR
jgi:hypothetical protein